MLDGLVKSRIHLNPDLVIYLTKMIGDPDIPWNRKIIGHQVGLGYKVQGSLFKVKCFALFPYLLIPLG